MARKPLKEIKFCASVFFYANTHRTSTFLGCFATMVCGKHHVDYA